MPHPQVHVRQQAASTYVVFICSLASVRVTDSLKRVLGVFLADPTSRRYGYDLMKAARLPSGTLYPMLARLQDEGLVTSEWEPNAADPGRPPRKYYQLTGEGARIARLELARGSQARPHKPGTYRPAHGAGR
jgi:PadR family transcriptional regulator, regulatory protein PadR